MKKQSEPRSRNKRSRVFDTLCVVVITPILIPTVIGWLIYIGKSEREGLIKMVVDGMVI